MTASRSVQPSGGGFLWARLMVLILGIWALGIAFRYTPERPPPGLICSFKAATGMECPACGITRALMALAHGRPADAYRYYSPVFPVFLGIWIGLAGAVLPASVWRRLMSRRWFAGVLAGSAGGTALWILVRWIIRSVITRR